MTRARLLIADDHALMLDGLRRLLERGEFEVLGTYEDGRTLVEATQKLVPDAVLLDISMPLLNGMDAAVQIRKSVPSVRVIFITMHAEPEFVQQAFQAGAVGYVDKRCTGPELVNAVNEVLQGRIYVSPRIQSESGLQIDGQNPIPTVNVPSLTTRQREVLQLVAEGHADKEIASLLHVSEKTVEFHKASIRKQLNLHSTAEMTRYAIKHGLSEG